MNGPEHADGRCYANLPCLESNRLPLDTGIRSAGQNLPLIIESHSLSSAYAIENFHPVAS
jgi:hypothetical protein